MDTETQAEFMVEQHEKTRAVLEKGLRHLLARWRTMPLPSSLQR
jgi:hypothetical protein